jgi:predicted transcriptional regulator
MSTTSLKLTDEIKVKVADAAKELGMSSHAFMVEAIRHASVNAEYRKAFMSEAKAARASTLETNSVYEAQEVFEHLRSRIAKQATSLKPKSW